MTAVRFSPDDTHCSIFVVANMITPTSSNINNHLNSSESSINYNPGGRSSGSTGTNTTTTANTNTNTSSSTSSSSTPNTNTNTNFPAKHKVLKRLSNSSESSKRCNSVATNDGDNEVITEVVTAEKSTTEQYSTTCKDDVNEKDVTEEIDEDNVGDAADGAEKDDEAGDEEEEEEDNEEEYIDPHDDDTVPLNHILDANHNNHNHYNQIVAIGDDNPVNQEILRGVEIVSQVHVFSYQQ